MRKATDVQLMLRDGGVEVSTISRRGNVFTVKKSYFYGATVDSTPFRDKVVEAIKKGSHNRQLAVVDPTIAHHGNHFHHFVGGAKPGSAQDSYLWVKFTIEDNQEMVTVKSLMGGSDCQIRACDVGGPCDPSTERYWSM